MALIDFLERTGLDDMKEKIEKAEAKVADQERTVAHLKQQLDEDLTKEHEARNGNDLEAAQRFARHAEQRKEDLRREKEALQEIRIDRDEAKGRIQNLLLDALNELDQTE